MVAAVSHVPNKKKTDGEGRRCRVSMALQSARLYDKLQVTLMGNAGSRRDA